MPLVWAWIASQKHWVTQDNSNTAQKGTNMATTVVSTVADNTEGEINTDNTESEIKRGRERDLGLYSHV